MIQIYSTSDFGLSKIVGQNLENSNNRNIFEVLCGEEYTKAADIYSFGIIVYEIITGFAPYYDVPHDAMDYGQKFHFILQN
ncbi:hypothetical protein Glove_421g28 [Diversispora epigaea]|uniref:Protein kinase domain-containing protein n=1 Tax=Diversispora epigaea TaxID=1348612 RepID=A0A397GVD1_9GLOM|nr:hypothetical protein Glove_421g28 [Diversispora epigaea]